MIIIFRIDILTNNFLVLEVKLTEGINGSVRTSEKDIVLTLVEANTKFYLSLYYNSNESYLYVNKTNIFKFKAKDNISWYNFCLARISKDFTKDEQREISLTSLLMHLITQNV